MSATPFCVARVEIRPRDAAQLGLAPADAAAVIRRAFGAPCVHAGAVSIAGGAWRATVALDVRRAAQAELLMAHAGDDRLWKSFVESAYGDGACDVLALERASSPPAASARAR